jgi:hypothetical protein
MLVKIIEIKKIRKDGTSEDICKRRRSPNLN